MTGSGQNKEKAYLGIVFGLFLLDELGVQLDPHLLDRHALPQSHLCQLLVDLIIRLIFTLHVRISSGLLHQSVQIDIRSLLLLDTRG